MKENIILTGDKVKIARLITLKHGLKLELKGLKISRGASCYSIIKKEFNLTGNKKKVLEQFEEILKQNEIGA